MCPYTFKDSNSPDPATYGDFIKSLNACYAQTNKEDVFTAHKAAVKFLEMYRDEFGFEIDECIKRLTLDMHKEEFDSLV